MAFTRRLTSCSFNLGEYLVASKKHIISNKRQFCNLSNTSLASYKNINKLPNAVYSKETHGYLKTWSCTRTLVRQLYVTNCALKKKKTPREESVSEELLQDDIDDSFLEDEDFDSLRGDTGILRFEDSISRGRPGGVMVLQPWVKWGASKRRDTSGQLLLDEAVALVNTLPGVHVAQKEIVPVKTMDRKLVFGSGTLERLAEQAGKGHTISWIFISVGMLRRRQISELEEAFGRKVLDRYSVVLGIFRHHARTKEARLQVALAELPYMRKRVSGERGNLLIMEREKYLKAALDKLAGVRSIIRRRRMKESIPTVAVVGYTNSGKTSLIRTITSDVRAEGRDQLFATLDVTAHGGHLPCGLEVLFIDTVGFIQDIPTELVASFKATLEDAVYSNVVVHVRDASHPDYELQGSTVSQTLTSLPLPEDTPVITVANKMDLETARPEDQLEGAHLISALTGRGVEDLLYHVEKEVLRVTGRKVWKFSLPTGSYQIQWLRKVTGVACEEVDEADPQTTHVLAVLTNQELANFHRNFGKQ